MFRRLFGSTANQYKKIHIDTNDIEHGHDSDDEPIWSEPETLLRNERLNSVDMHRNVAGVHVHSHMSICSTCCFFINRTAVRIYILGSNIIMSPIVFFAFVHFEVVR